MDNITELLNVENAESANGDYTKDGLLHCGKCNVPKEKELEVMGEIELFPHMCECERAEHGRKQAEEAEAERRYRIRELRNEYIKDPRYKEPTFDIADGDLQWAENYVEAWDNIKADSTMGLLLFGDTGTGKTFAACCIGNALIEHETRVMIANMSDLLNDVGNLKDYPREEAIKKIQSCDLLIIDDFGVTRNTEYANEIVYKIIDIRYRAKKPMIITTNLTPAMLTNETNIDLKRTYQRIIECCRAKEMNGINHRVNIAKQSKIKMDEILNNGTA